MDVALIPHEVLFGETATTSPLLSPDGLRIAFLAPRDGVPNLVVDDGTTRRALTADTARGIAVFTWLHDSRHLVYEQDVGGDENMGLYLCDVVTGETRTLVAMPSVRARLLRVAPALRDTICVALNADDPRWHDVYHVDVPTGTLRKVAANEGFTRWVVDAALQARGAVRSTDDGCVEVLVREDDGWRSLLVVDLDDGLPVLFDDFPLRFSDDNRWLFAVTSLGSDATYVARIDVETGDVQRVAGTGEADVGAVEFDPRTGEPQLVVVPVERNRYLVCDETVAADVDAVRALHPGDFSILSRDAADRRWTVEFTSDRGSRAYFLYDRDERAGELLFHAQPELEDLPLAAMESFSYPARDGLRIPGYLTFPPDAPRRGLPTVVMVHGGPAARDQWGFHPLAQLLANRGYLAVQVNYRGSIGYGKRFLAAGDGEWARAMHHDIVDAVGWVVSQGYADPERIGMWGTSYGGYETLVTVTSDPHLMRCAVAVVAPVNLVTLLRSIPPYWLAEREYFRKVLGEDEDELWQRSPLRLVDRIAVPLLLVYGASDPRVPVSEARQIAEALERNAIPHELHVIPDEGHFLGRQMSTEHRALYLRRLEKFYAEHLGGRCAS